jgi:exodeoxyribonuclease X
MEAIIFDTETTSATDPEIIEAAWLAGEVVEGGFLVHDSSVCQYKPSSAITLGAMATHHIIPDDLIDCPPSSEFAMPEVKYIIGHKVDFDWEAAGKPDVKRICTLAIARYLLPQLDAHTQTALLYHIYPPRIARTRAQGAHSALVDVGICKDILDYLMELANQMHGAGCLSTPCLSIEDLYQLSERARIPTVMSFGKHKGMAVKDIPYDYKLWLLKQADLDPYMRIALSQPRG